MATIAASVAVPLVDWPGARNGVGRDLSAPATAAATRRTGSRRALDDDRRRANRHLGQSSARPRLLQRPAWPAHVDIPASDRDRRRGPVGASHRSGASGSVAGATGSMRRQCREPRRWTWAADRRGRGGVWASSCPPIALSANVHDYLTARFGAVSRTDVAPTSDPDAETGPEAEPAGNETRFFFLAQPRCAASPRPATRRAAGCRRRVDAGHLPGTPECAAVVSARCGLSRQPQRMATLLPAARRLRTRPSRSWCGWARPNMSFSRCRDTATPSAR